MKQLKLMNFPTLCGESYEAFAVEINETRDFWTAAKYKIIWNFTEYYDNTDAQNDSMQSNSGVISEDFEVWLDNKQLDSGEFSIIKNQYSVKFLEDLGA